jgi:hypothetical protein
VPAFRSVVSVLVIIAVRTFLCELKATRREPGGGLTLTSWNSRRERREHIVLGGGAMNISGRN